MAMRKKPKPKEHIDEILGQWPYDPDAVSVRMVEGMDGRKLIQMRIEMGLLQLETSGRPDGERPEGAPTYLDYLRGKSRKNGDTYLFSVEECAEADREFIQYYHRRICWLAMREFRKAVRDADHTLKLMDLCRSHSPDEEWTISHEQYRPFVLFHRIQADALAELDANGPEAAVEAVNRGLERLRQVYEDFGDEVAFDENELVDRLFEFRETLRDRFDVGKTLDEQLAEAVAAEEYEKAAKLRDAIKASQRKEI
jgi:hypothetical protein